MKQYNSQIRYVEARPRKEKNRAKATASVVVAGSASSSVGGVSKSYVDSNFVTLATEQDIQGKKNFVGGLGVNGQYITYNAEKKYWELVGDLIVRGAITMFGSSAGFVPSTIMDGVQVDNDTIIINAAGQLQVIGGGGSGGTGGGLTAAEINALISNALKPYALSSSIPTDNKQLTNGAGYITASALSGLATEQYVTTRGYITSDALAGYATESWVEGKKYLTGITSSQVTTALGFTPYDSANPDKYIKGIDYDMVIAALGYTPYSTTNPMGYLTISSLLGYATEQWVGDNYLAKSGGTINGGTYAPLKIVGTSTRASIGFSKDASAFAYLTYNGGNSWAVTNEYYNQEYALLHSGNYTDYFTKSNIKSTLGISDWALAATKPSYTAAEVGALATSGGTISGDLTLSSANAARVIRFDTSVGSSWLFVNSGEWYVTNIGWGAEYKLIHSNNIGLYNAGSASKLQTPRTIWGQSFDGTGDITGFPSFPQYININRKADSGAIMNPSLLGCEIEAYSSYLALKSYSNDGNNISAHLCLIKGGNVAIGGTTANAKLHVYGNARIDGDVLGRALINFDTATTASDRFFVGSGAGGVGIAGLLHYVYDDSPIMFWNNGFERMRVAGNGNIAIGRPDASAKLHVGGDIIADGAITMFSQLSMKNVIDYYGLSLAQLAQIRPARFTWKDNRDNRIHVGCIADYIQPILPEVVYETANKELTVDYGSAAFYIGASLIKPVVELWEIKDNHEKRIAELEREVKYLREENRQLRAS